MVQYERKKIRVCHIATTDFAIRFLLLHQLQYLQKIGYNISSVCSPGNWVAEIKQQGISVYTIPMTRSITPVQDVVSLWRLFWYLRKEQFDVVHTHTPKAGLVGVWAATLAKTPIVIHSNHGLYFHEYTSPPKRLFFKWMERLTVLFADLILSVNREDMKTAQRKSIGRIGNWRYLGGWVDMRRFDRTRFSQEFISQKKKEIGVPDDVPIIGIVARLVREKGYFELFEAFKQVKTKFPNAVLLVIGFEEPEKKDAFDPSVVQQYGIENNVRFLGARMDVEELYPLMDVFTLPSHREGIGTSILEASAMQLPVVATNVRGCREAVENGKTGILVQHKNPKKLAEALMQILEHPQLAAKMGEAGLEKIKEQYDERLVFERLEREYDRLIKEKLDLSI